MIERIVCGHVPRKHHIVMRDAKGALVHEECLTRQGFDGPYTIMYHQHRPHTQRVAPTQHGWQLRQVADERHLAKRHYRTQQLEPRRGPAMDSRVPLLYNDDVVVGMVYPDREDPAYFINADADDLFYIFQGSGVLRSPLGDLPFKQDDYVYVPRGLLHRFIPSATPGSATGHAPASAGGGDSLVRGAPRSAQGGAQPQVWLSMECLGGMGLLRQWRNEVGQLRMDAPYSHRDFQLPTFVGPQDEGIRELVVKRGGQFHGFVYESSPLDVVGWDGTVYPFVFPILNFQPRAGLVHLPPTWHGTFAAQGALICSFVPRMVDFHPEAIPCPYPHASVDCDEVLFYVRGNFTSRKGVGPGSISHHPAGIPHGPHPGAYEASIGTKTTEELAVMMDTFKPLQPTQDALGIEDPDYQDSFVEH